MTVLYIATLQDGILSPGVVPVNNKRMEEGELPAIS